jgi:hypothetical protein
MVLNVKVGLFQAIILLLPRTDIKVLKKHSGMLGSILDLLKYRFGAVIPVVKILFGCPPPYKF